MVSKASECKACGWESFLLNYWGQTGDKNPGSASQVQSSLPCEEVPGVANTESKHVELSPLRQAPSVACPVGSKLGRESLGLSPGCSSPEGAKPLEGSIRGSKPYLV